MISNLLKILHGDFKDAILEKKRKDRHFSSVFLSPIMSYYYLIWMSQITYGTLVWLFKNRPLFAKTDSKFQVPNPIVSSVQHTDTCVIQSVHTDILNKQWPHSANRRPCYIKDNNLPTDQVPHPFPVTSYINCDVIYSMIYVARSPVT